MHPKLALVGLTCLALLGPVGPGSAAPTDLTLPEARKMALEASLQGRHALAVTLARELLKADPQDPAALLALATMRLATGDAAGAYRLGRLSFRNADSRALHHQAARVTALSALAQDQTLRTRFWLRRAADTAPDPLSRARVMRNYRLLQEKSPWRLKFNLAFSPSDNVNGGSDSAFNIIDGVPLVGLLSPSAQALPGLVAQASANLSYRLSESATRQTLLTGALAIKRVRLDPGAQGAPLPPPFTTPQLTNSDLAATSAQLGLSHVSRPQDSALTRNYDLTFTGVWQAGTRAYFGVDAGVELQLALDKTKTATASLGVEHRSHASGRDARIVTFGAGMTFLLPNASRLRAAMQLRHSDGPVFTSRSAVAQINWALGKPIRSVALSITVGGSYVDYPTYSVGFIGVPGGRQDESLFAQIDATFTAVQYAGFSPSLRLRHTRTDSNVSRFAGSELALSVGFESRF